MALPEKRVIERVDKSVGLLDQRYRQGIGFLPGGAMHADFGALLLDQSFGPLRGGFRNNDYHWNGKKAAGIGYGDAGIPAGGGNETSGAAPGVFLAGQPDSTELERTGWL